jgi:uncharacterized membrane protein YraQ (UPF0718 family)
VGGGLGQTAGMVTDRAGPGRRAIPGPPVVPLLLSGVAALVLVGRPMFDVLVGSSPALQAWATVFVAIVLQAVPFLVLGTLLSAAIATFVAPETVARVVPRRRLLAVPVAGLAGAALPTCECTSVPIAGRMIATGVPVSAALTFLLSAPAINPIVLTATAVAFPNDPEMVLARLVASLLLAVVMGAAWEWLGRPQWLRPPARVHVHRGSRAVTFRLVAQHDFLQAGGFLVLGALFSATLNVAVDPTWTAAVAGLPVVSVLVLAGLAVVLAICSEADAFVAASLSGFSLTAKLAFLVVGPAVDVKLVALQAGMLGRRFAARFAPATFGVAVAVSALVGGLLL